MEFGLSVFSTIRQEESGFAAALMVIEQLAPHHVAGS
jgi:hypothetical protein